MSIFRKKRLEEIVPTVAEDNEPADLVYEYRAFREGFQAEKLPELALYRPRYPFGETVVVVGMQTDIQRKHLEGFAEKQEMHLFYMTGALVISTLTPNTDKNGVRYIFSGLARWQGKLVFGEI